MSFTSPPPLSQLQATSGTHRQPPRGQAHVIHTPTPSTRSDTLTQIGHTHSGTHPFVPGHTSRALSHTYTQTTVFTDLHPEMEPHLQGDARCHTQRHARNAEGCSPAQRRPPTHKLQTQVNSVMTTSEIPPPLHTFIQSFIQHRFTGHLLCARGCSRLWGSSSEQNKDACPGGMDTPVGLVGSTQIQIGDVGWHRGKKKAVRQVENLLQGGILEAAAPTEGGREPVTSHTATCRHVPCSFTRACPHQGRCVAWCPACPLHQSFLLRGWA